MTSLNDIAKHLDLSPMTVSRVVNNVGNVSPATRDRVLAAMRELGYKRDEYASINAQKRGNRPALRHVIVDAAEEDPKARARFAFFSNIALSILHRLNRLECRFTVTDLERSTDEHLDALTSADAIIFCSPVSAATVETVRKMNRDIQGVAICQHSCAGFTSVDPDDEAGGRLAAEAFAQAGYERVLTFGTEDQQSQALRLDSFTRNLQRLCPQVRIDHLRYGVKPDGVWTDSETAMLTPVATYWRDHGAPEAIFIPGGYATFLLYRFLRRQGIRIPGDIGLMGYDDLAFYDYLDDPLDRVVFDTSALAHHAVDALLPFLTKGIIPRGTSRILVPASYTPRGSIRSLATLP